MNSAKALSDSRLGPDSGPREHGVGAGMTPRAISGLVMLLLVTSAQEAWSQVGGGSTYADIAPILAQRCVMCHSGAAASLGLRLDSFDGVVKGSERGPVVKAGDPSGSELIRRLKGVSRCRDQAPGRARCRATRRGPGGDVSPRRANPCHALRQVPCREGLDGRGAGRLSAHVV